MRMTAKEVQKSLRCFQAFLPQTGSLPRLKMREGVL
jgi:hypothetical protein